MLTVNVPQVDILHTMLVSHIESEIKQLVEKETADAVERVRREIPAICARVGVKVQEWVRYETRGTELVITIAGIK